MKKNIAIYFLVILSFLYIINPTIAQISEKAFDFNFTNKDTAWADSIISTLSARDRIAQLFVISVAANQSKKYIDAIDSIICDYKPGGVCFFQGSPYREASITNHFQSLTQTPLFIAIDGEWGLAMRLDSIIAFPRQMTLGAIKTDTLIYLMGKEIARQCKRMGIHINFAPVADVNSNRNNPVINSRSFSENKFIVAERSVLYMKALQDNGILACAKHFPGHGDTDTDSHKALPIINHSYQTIDTLDLYPFKQLFKNGLGSTMVAHLYIPILDTSKNTAISLSKTVVTQLLKEKLNFKGLVFTDAMDMKGVSDYFKNGTAELKAIEAGNDMILLPQNMHNAIIKIQKAIDSCKIYQKDIDATCRKILIFKHKLGLAKIKPISLTNISADLNTPQTQLLQRKLYENSITLVKNEDDIIPLKHLEQLDIATVSIGDTMLTVFQKTLSNYANIDHFNIVSDPAKEYTDSIVKILSKYDLIIAGIHKTVMYPNYNITKQVIEFIDSLQRKTKVILDIFGNPYSLHLFNESEKLKAIIISYQGNSTSENTSAQMIMGGITINGRLPVTATSAFLYNTSIETKDILRLKYTIPEELGINSAYLKKVDSIAQDGIEKKAYPGCQVLLVKDGKVFYRKSFGYHTYLNKTPVSNDDLYDMASITKVEATTVAMMKLVDNNKINLDAKLGKYLPLVKGTNKENLVIRDILAHQAQLQSWIPFYSKTLHKYYLDTNIYHKVKTDKFPYQVADSIFIRRDYHDTIMKNIMDSPLNKKKEYVYSDIGFYLLKELIEKITKQDIESYLSENFYKPLGMAHTLYNPLRLFNIKSIAPTENDTIFRKQIVHGFVHDPGAAMLGGVSGHAGLFSNANDLAIFLQMLLQKGQYANVRYLQEKTVNEFTKYQFPKNDNRRGLGFDKPPLSVQKSSPTCPSASPESYGHSGFTGTFFWVDPKENLIVIILNNRVFPNALNNKIIELNLRTSLQQAVYDAINKSKIEN